MVVEEEAVVEAGPVTDVEEEAVMVVVEAVTVVVEAAMVAEEEAVGVTTEVIAALADIAATGTVGIKTVVSREAALTGVIAGMIVEVVVPKMVADVIVVAAHKGVRAMIGNLLSGVLCV